MPNLTLPSSRTDFIDPRTGKLSREWYLFFLSLYTGGTTSGESALTSPDISTVVSQVGELSKSIQGIEVQPRYEPESLFTASGAGAITKTMQAKVRESISVLDFGAVGDGVTDDLPAFQAAVDSLPALGGRILVPDNGNYFISARPNWGNKSLYWDIGMGCTFSGPGSVSGSLGWLQPTGFPYCATNVAQYAAGPYLVSQSPIHSTDPNGGIATLSVEMYQPIDYGVGQSVSLFVGAATNNPDSAGNIWAINPVLNMAPGSGGIGQGIEVDIDVFSSTCRTRGISISGLGDFNPDTGLEITRVAGTQWKQGIDIYESIIGIRVNPSCSGGISINAPAQTVDTPIGAKQRISGGDTVVLQRTSDSTVGNYIRGTNSTNTTNLFTINGAGDSYFQLGTYDGFLTCNGGMGTSYAIIASGATSVPAGYFCLGNTVAGTANAGGATLPANPVQFWAIIIGSTIYKIPLYAN